MSGSKKTRPISKKEEEALIQMFSRDVGSKGNASFAINALLAAATPLFLYIRIQQVDVTSAWHVMAVVTCVTAYVLQYTYAKAKFGLKQKMASSIHEGIVREVNGSLSETDRKKLTAQQAVFQTNIIFFGLVLLGSFGLFGAWEPIPNF